MCSPHLSFLIDKFKKIFYRDGKQSHEDLITHFGLDDSKVIKVSYDWVNRVINIIGENEDDAGNRLLPFELKYGHYVEIENFIKNKVGTKEKLANWLSKNMHKDRKVFKEINKLFTKSIGKINFQNIKKYLNDDNFIVNCWKNNQGDVYGKRCVA